LRLSDGKKRSSLGKVHRLLLDIDQGLRKPIVGVEEEQREGFRALFSARWRYFHQPVMTAAYMLEPEYCRTDFRQVEAEEDAGGTLDCTGNNYYYRNLHACFKQAATAVYPFGDLVADYAKFVHYLST